MASLLSNFFTSLPLVLGYFLPAFMIAWTRIFYWRQMFHIRNLNPKSFWSQSHTRTTGVLSRFYVPLRSLSWSQVLYWKWHSTYMGSPLITPTPLSCLAITAKGTRRYMDSWACQAVLLYCSPKWLLQLIFVIHLFNLFSIQCWNLFSILVLPSVLRLIFSSSWVSFFSERPFLSDISRNEWHMSIGC